MSHRVIGFANDSFVSKSMAEAFHYCIMIQLLSEWVHCCTQMIRVRFGIDFVNGSSMCLNFPGILCSVATISMQNPQKNPFMRYV